MSPGIYEVTADVDGRDARQWTRERLEANIRDAYGNLVSVRDYSATSASTLQVQVEVAEPPTPAEGELQAMFVIPLIYAAAILASGFLIWRTAVTVRKVVELTVASPGGQVAAAGLGLGVLALGIAAIIFLVIPRGRSPGG